MERRELLKMIAVLTGGAVIGGDMFLAGCTSKEADASTFSADNLALMNEIGETILPATATPGAKAADVASFMKMMVTDCYNPAQQKVFNEGIKGFNDACKKANGKSFMDCSADQRKAFLVSLEKEAKEFNKQRDLREKEAREKAKKEMDPDYVGGPSHYYTMLKQLTLTGFFTSEIGCKQALRLNPIPGKYDGAFPYKKGDKAWAI
ncbi:gluconate 2-dehydrogenase subunit 3 family protein [Ferruginibacter sp.]